MGRIAAFVIGGLVGAGIMAATAPKSGKETRKQVVDAFNEVKDQAVAANAEGGVAQVATEFAEKGKSIASDVMAGGQEAVAAATARVQDAAADITGTADTDDLKKKIEEARSRIVDQVMKNAKDSHEAVDGTVVAEVEEAVVEAVEDVEAAEDDEDAPAAEDAEAAEEATEE
jgi:gas vesicle protein